MANVETRLVIKHNAESLQSILDIMSDSNSRPHPFAQKLVNFFKAINGGSRSASVKWQISSDVDVVASGTVTCASATAADTVTVQGTVLTADASLQDATHFKVGVSDTADAAALATCINASAAKKYVFATSSGAICTITASRPGIIGNLVTLATSNNTRLAKSGTTLASGDNVAPTQLPVTVSFGL